MIMAGCMAAALFLLLAPFCIWICLPDPVFEKESGRGFWRVLSVIVFLAGIECAYLLSVFLGKGLKVFRVLLLLYGAVLFLCALLRLILSASVRGRIRQSLSGVLGKLKENKAEGIAAVLAFCLIFFSHLFCRLPADSFLYDTAERAVTIAASGSFFAADPLTGAPAAGAASLSEKLYGLPAFYAALSGLFHIPLLTLLSVLIPACVILSALLVLSPVKEVFLPKGGVWLYAAFTLAALFAGSAYRNPFYDLLYLPYEGRCLMAFLILPGALAGAICLIRRIKAKPGQKGRSLVALLILSAVCFFLTALLAGGLFEGLLLLLLLLALWGICVWISRFIT